jgi:heat shock protein beta
VSETAKGDTRVKPAPPVDPSLESEDDEEAKTKGPHFDIPSVLKDKVSVTMEEIHESETVHDEL